VVLPAHLRELMEVTLLLWARRLRMLGRLRRRFRGLALLFKWKGLELRHGDEVDERIRGESLNWMVELVCCAAY
jgi:hypothetical protein